MREIADRLEELRAAGPLVHCLSNYVSMSISANVLLAAGASPAMAHAVEEAAEFAGLAGSVVVNIGTLSTPWIESMKAAAATARARKIPWALDPVAHFATGLRRQTCAELMALGPTIVRGNASEILALSGAASAGRGVDAGDGMERALDAAIAVARRSGAVVATTGEVDVVTDGRRVARVTGGSALMPKVTALGCALTCLCGAFAAAAPDDPFEATLAALACYAAAGTAAERRAQGPGSFAVAFLDALANLDAEGLTAGVSVERL
jgi:hydroxyethylthiazole kinase